MVKKINMYSDESSHIGTSHSHMVIGAIWCDKDEVRDFSDKVKMLKIRHHISPRREMKWVKVSESKKDYYLDLVRLFFDDDGINFRAIVIDNASLDHKKYQQTADDFYYKAQYMMIKNVALKHPADYSVFLDYKDIWSGQKSRKLAEFLNNTKCFRGVSFFRCQPIRSYESALLQVSDLLIGALASANDSIPTKVNAKREIVGLIETLSGQTLTDSTPPGFDKFNIFLWRGREEGVK